MAATISSGVRSVYCYCPTARIKTWKPKFEVDEALLPDWVFEQLATLSRDAPFGDGRVTIGFGFDMFFLPKEVVVGVFEKVRALGLKTITSHYVKSHFGS